MVNDLEREFGPFDLDPCATPQNAKALCFFTETMNGLAQPWGAASSLCDVGRRPLHFFHERVFCNPPYSAVDVWIRKAIEEAAAWGLFVVLLLPVRTDRDWWHDLLQPHARIRFLRGRQRFIGPDGTTIGRPAFASCLAFLGESP